MPEPSAPHTPLAGLTLKQCMLWALGRRKRLRVSGASMAPTFADGQEVLVDTSAPARWNNLKLGDLVWLRHPLKSNVTMVKRIAKIDQNSIDVLGDNPQESSDSRHWGPVPRKFILGTVACTFP